MEGWRKRFRILRGHGTVDLINVSAVPLHRNQYQRELKKSNRENRASPARSVGSPVAANLGPERDGGVEAMLHIKSWVILTREQGILKYYLGVRDRTNRNLAADREFPSSKHPIVIPTI